MPETTAPLTEQEIAAIEARLKLETDGDAVFILSEVPALIRDWRAMRAELGQRKRTMEHWEQSYLAEHETWGNCKWKAENAALREQLAQVEKERELCRQVQKRGVHSSITCPCVIAMERK